MNVFNYWKETELIQYHDYTISYHLHVFQVHLKLAEHLKHRCTECDYASVNVSEHQSHFEWRNWSIILDYGDALAAYSWQDLSPWPADKVADMAVNSVVLRN